MGKKIKKLRITSPENTVKIEQNIKGFQNQQQKYQVCHPQKLLKTGYWI